MSESRRFTEGLLIGGLLGVAAGLLLAPKPGEDMRKEIGHKVQEAVNKLDQAVQEGRDAIEIAIAKGKEVCNIEKEQTKAAFEEVIDKLEAEKP